MTPADIGVLLSLLFLIAAIRWAAARQKRKRRY